MSNSAEIQVGGVMSLSRSRPSSRVESGRSSAYRIDVEDVVPRNRRGVLLYSYDSDPSKELYATETSQCRANGALGVYC